MSDLHSHVRALNEKRMRIWEETRGFLDRIDARGSDMNAEERAQYTRYNEAIDELDAEIRTFVDRERRESEYAALRNDNPAVFGGSQFDGSRPDRDESAIVRRMLTDRGFHGTLSLPLAKVAKERQMLRDGATMHEIRTLLWDTGSVGSAVPVSMARSLYEALEAQVSLLRAPTTKINTSSGEDMDFPKLVTHSIGTQVIAQGTAIGGTDPVFGKMTLEAFKYGEIVQVANEVVEDPVVDILSFLGRDMGRAVGRLVGADLVVGSGTGEPRGIITAAVADAGSVVTGGTLIPASYETLVDLAYGIPDTYRQNGAAGWMFKDSTAAAIRKLRDGAGGTLGAPLWEPSLTNGIQGGQPDRLLGYPVYPDLNVAAQGSASRSILFADFSAYYVRTVGDITIERSDDFAFDKDLVTMRAKWRVDGDLIDSGAAITSKQAPS